MMRSNDDDDDDGDSCECAQPSQCIYGILGSDVGSEGGKEGGRGVGVVVRQAGSPGASEPIAPGGFVDCGRDGGVVNCTWIFDNEDHRGRRAFPISSVTVCFACSLCLSFVNTCPPPGPGLSFAPTRSRSPTNSRVWLSHYPAEY